MSFKKYLLNNQEMRVFSIAECFPGVQDFYSGYLFFLPQGVFSDFGIFMVEIWDF